MGSVAIQSLPCNAAENRAEFLKDEAAYCERYGLNDEHKRAIRERDVLGLIAAGGNVRERW